MERHGLRWPSVVAWFTLGVAGVMAVAPQAPGGWDPNGCLLGRSLVSPSFPAHPFGFDIQGCDLLIMSISGSRNSLLVGVLSTVMALAVALPLGVIAGLRRGWVDSLVGRLVEVTASLPIILVGLLILSGIDERGVVLVSGVMAVAAWPIHTRVVRSAAMRVSAEPYVDAARALGAGTIRLLGRHVLPAAAGATIAVIPTTVAFSIGIESVLTFLGAGLQLPDVSWGVLLGEAQNSISRAPHLLLPGLFLIAVIGALVVVAEQYRRVAMQ
jgi:ABC-type dipeptide/oligopeptide/nickel transport system permease subunit